MPKPRKLRPPHTPETRAKLSGANPPDSISRVNLNHAIDQPGQTQQISVRLGINQLKALDAIALPRSILIRTAINLFLKSFKTEQ